ncbi:hypothetical protein CK203_038615 [Vitis vinifera]|uniref:Uncharacterized protein n=1 Tax=Vitis vinifera TaxID=29760 RepID=A0A438I430_VITVI|nr:hypothetical protein CK203_038615 [Vitis vinifera]
MNLDHSVASLVSAKKKLCLPLSKTSRKPSKDKFYHNNEDDINQLDSSGDVSSQSSSDQDVLRVDQQSPKDVSIKELHEEVKQHKKEIKELRQFISLGLSDLQDQINRIGNQEIHTDIPESSHEQLKIAFKKVVPIPLCEETSESLFGANGQRLAIKVHEIMAPKKNTQASSSQKSQSSQANQSPSTHKMLWSQQVEEEEAQLLAKLHSSKPMHESSHMPNKMLTLYYDLLIILNLLRQHNIQLPQGLRPLSSQAVFPQEPSQVSASDDMSQFLLKKQQLQAMLAAAKTPQEFQKILDEGSSSFSQENSYAESDDSTSYLPDNGDDFSVPKAASMCLHSIKQLAKSSQPKKVFRGFRAMWEGSWVLFWVFLDYPRIGSSVPGSASPAG